MGSESAKEQFLTQLEAILESLRQTVTKAEKRRLNEKLKRDQLNDKYMELLEKQRFYSKLIKEFQQVYQRLILTVPLCHRFSTRNTAGGAKGCWLWFFGVLRSAIRKGFPKVSIENLILLIQYHNPTKNQRRKRETEGVRELTKRIKIDSQSINQL